MANSRKQQKETTEILVDDVGRGDLEATQVVVKEPNPGTEPVSREEFDRAIKHIQNDISKIREDLEQRVTDLENLVGQPEGGVQFFTPQIGETAEGNSVQDYLPLDEGDQGDVPWYQPIR